MYVVCVSVSVKSDQVDAFLEATFDNAQHTRTERGNLRFDVIQQEDDPTKFFLYEAYFTKSDFETHHQTPHYLKWKSAVTDMMAEPRVAKKYNSRFFGDGIR
ncbi:MAG TPA: antibiotic biosynthesis monooxygenase [Tepidisphaeraceae bacterium]|jgi:quinol monooxygenase YgiN